MTASAACLPSSNSFSFRKKSSWKLRKLEILNANYTLEFAVGWSRATDWTKEDNDEFFVSPKSRPISIRIENNRRYMQIHERVLLEFSIRLFILMSWQSINSVPSQAIKQTFLWIQPIHIYDDNCLKANHLLCDSIELGVAPIETCFPSQFSFTATLKLWGET